MKERGIEMIYAHTHYAEKKVKPHIVKVRCTGHYTCHADNEGWEMIGVGLTADEAYKHWLSKRYLLEQNSPCYP